MNRKVRNLSTEYPSIKRVSFVAYYPRLHWKEMDFLVESKYSRARIIADIREYIKVEEMGEAPEFIQTWWQLETTGETSFSLRVRFKSW